MQGQYLDRETGLHYSTFRFYDPDLSAFISPDPIGLRGGTNLHSYAPNPISWIDPLGWDKLCAFGNKTEPRSPKAGKDIPVDDAGNVKSQADVQWPKGASTTTQPQNAPLSGPYHTIPEGTKMPDGLGIKKDGSDVGGPHAPGHQTIYPTRDMPFTKFVDLFKSLPWEYGGKK